MTEGMIFKAVTCYALPLSLFMFPCSCLSSLCLKSKVNLKFFFSTNLRRKDHQVVLLFLLFF